MSDGPDRVADDLRRVREAVRRRALLERDPAAVLPKGLPTGTPKPVPIEPAPEPPPLPPPPDGSAVNTLWRAEPEPRGGVAGLVGRFLHRLLARRFEAQVAWNSKQVQLDNDLLGYVDARFAATHRHYDQILGHVGRHLGEADERHLILQEELVAHVHDLVKRIDIALSEGERGRLAQAHTLEDLRVRLVRLEERLARG